MMNLKTKIILTSDCKWCQKWRPNGRIIRARLNFMAVKIIYNASGKVLSVSKVQKRAKEQQKTKKNKKCWTK